jgi:hypothetical protein
VRGVVGQRPLRALDGAAAPSKPKMLFEHSLLLVIVGRHA